GEYPRALDEALRIADLPRLRDEQRERRERGDPRQLGIGVSTYVEITAFSGKEFGSVEVDPGGDVTVRVGTSAHGQGHETALAQLAAAAGDPSRPREARAPGLSATADFRSKESTFPFGSHVAVVEVDVETGAARLIRYVAVDDCGRILNPMLVDGQVHGGLA